MQNLRYYLYLVFFVAFGGSCITLSDSGPDVGSNVALIAQASDCFEVLWDGAAVSPVGLSTEGAVTQADISLFDKNFFRKTVIKGKYTKAISDFANNEPQSWKLHEGIKSLIAMYELTGDHKYFVAVSCFADVIADNYIHGISPPTTRAPIYDFDAGINYKWAEHTSPGENDVGINDPEVLVLELHQIGQYSEILSWFARTVSEDPALQSEFGDRAILYTQIALEAIDRFDEHLVPDQNYYYHYTMPRLVNDDALTNQECIDMWETNNVQNIAFRAMIDTIAVIHSDFFTGTGSSWVGSINYADQLPKILAGGIRSFQQDLEFNVDTEGYVWGRYPRRYEMNACRCWGDDFSHGAETADFIVKLWKNLQLINSHLPVSQQIVLSELTMERLGNTFLDPMGSSDPLFFLQHVDAYGGGALCLPSTSPFIQNEANRPLLNESTAGWIQLAAFGRKVFDRAKDTALWEDLGTPETWAKGKVQPFLIGYNFARLLELKDFLARNIQVSFDGVNYWKPQNQLEPRPTTHTETPAQVLAGDFDGDGIDDLLKSGDGGQSGLYVSWGGTATWELLAASTTAPLDDLRIGDFDGNGTSDVFERSGSTWKVLFGDGAGNYSYRTIGSSELPLDGYRFGDFDGDGSTDIFSRSTYGSWEVSYGNLVGNNHSGWSYIGWSCEPLESLGFGDFDGDGVTDLFRIGAGGSTWEVSFGALGQNQHGGWAWVGTSTAEIADMRFADVDGDGITDIFSEDQGGIWIVSKGSVARTFGIWKDVNTIGGDPRDLGFANFDGQAPTDIYRLFFGGRGDTPVRKDWDNVAFMTGAGSELHVLRNSSLYTMEPGQTHRSILTDQACRESFWYGVKAMTSLNGETYVIRGNSLFKIDANGNYTYLPDQNGGYYAWTGTVTMTSRGAYLYIIQGSRLHRVTTSGAWTVLPDQNGNTAIWGGNVKMVGNGYYLFLVQNSTLHRVYSSGSYVVLPGNWSGTEGMASLNGRVFIVQSNKLHRLNYYGTSYSVLPDQNGNTSIWGGTTAITSMGDHLYIDQNSRMHEVDYYGRYTLIDR